MARPRFKPTEEQRRMVKTMSAYRMPHEDITTAVGLRSVKTLRRHFREELDRGVIEARAKVSQTAFQMAVSGKYPAMTMFWLKSNCGWRDGQEFDQRPRLVAPFVVEIERSSQ